MEAVIADETADDVVSAPTIDPICSGRAKDNVVASGSICTTASILDTVSFIASDDGRLLTSATLLG
jgi:hypothetical protein